MKYKSLMKILIIAFLVFLLTVALGIKYDWVQYLRSPPVVASPLLPEPQELLGNTMDYTKKKKSPSVQFEIVNELNVDSTMEERVKNDCIRASRRAGVGDDNIHAVVRECVELSIQKRVESSGYGSDSIAGENDKNRNADLTRRSCEIVAAEEQGIDEAAREKIVIQCIKANLGNSAQQ